MQAIDLRLNDHMEVIRIIPAQRKEMDKEFDYPNFPYICYDVNFHAFIGQRVHWHWHSSFHFIQGLRGCVQIRAGQATYMLNPGDVCFINSNTNHSMDPISAPEDCSIRTYTFYPDLLCGNLENTIATRYVQPILNHESLACVHILADQADELRNHLDEAQNAQRAKEFGYEFDVRYHLSRAWILMLKTLSLGEASTDSVDLRVRSRVITMLDFIRTNYTRKIELGDIAESAMISERECFRCFQKAMGITPTHYLQNFRVRLAARMLLETDDTISDISQAVGFNDTSYFGKTFQKYMHCSPSEFRRKHQGAYTPIDQVQY